MTIISNKQNKTKKKENNFDQKIEYLIFDSNSTKLINRKYLRHWPFYLIGKISLQVY